MKIYALQVDPEIQESPLFFDEEFFPEDINVFGNRYFDAHCTDVFTRVREVLYSGDLLDEWDKLNSGGRGWYSSWKEALEDLLPPEGREAYTREERKTRIPELLERFHSCRTREEDSVICEVLGVVTGKVWSHKTIRGCSQGDWQNVIYASDDWTPEQLNAFETEYFNTGSEWIIREEAPEPGELPDGVNGFSLYCHGWSDEQIKAEIRAEAGNEGDEVLLYKFAGYKKIPVYSLDDGNTPSVELRQKLTKAEICGLAS